jgi:DNA-binding CsgD family transcriptional regulator
MHPGAIFLDRVHETATLDTLLRSAGENTSGALVVYGDVGMGKSALLDYAVSSSDLPIARIWGVETERSFGFAALHRLLLPFLHQIDRVPARQRVALESAFGLLDAGLPDRFLVSLAALTLLSVGSASAGLLCVVDDAQWIDTESLQALAFVARRLQAEGIALLFGVRTITDVPVDLAGIPTLEVTGLPDDAASELLRAAAGRPVPEQVVKRVVRETGGCPLALWELGTTVTEHKFTGIGGLAEPMPITSRLREHFDTQISVLSSDAQLFLLAAAADETGNRALVHAVTSSLGCSAEAEVEAERHQLLLPGPRITFRHPLIRSTAYVGADPSRRREVHRAFANLIPKSAYPDRWARHVVLGATGPDAQLASELEETSRIAKARGGYAAEASLLVQAAELTDTLEQQAARLLRAATAALNAGDHNQTMELLDQSQPLLSEPFAIAEAALLRAQLSMRTYQNAVAPGELLEAARLFLPLDINRTREVLLETFLAYSISIDFTKGVEPRDIALVARSTAPEASRATLEDDLLDGTSLLFSDGPAAAFPRYRRAADIIREGSFSHDQLSRWSLLGITVANELLDDRTFLTLAEQTDRSARESGALLALLFNLFSLSESDVRAGNLQNASARHEESLDVAAALGLPIEFYLPMKADVHAWAGDEEMTRSCANVLIELHSAAGIAQSPMLWSRRALATLHLGAGRYGDALEATEFVHTQSPFGFTSMLLPLAIEAAARSNELGLAESLVMRLDGRARASGRPWALGLAARSRALLSGGPEAEEMYQSAIGLLADTLVARDLAYAQLLYGEWLRRENRQLDARVQLKAAHDFFVAMGAKAYARRAEAELLATGGHVRSRTVVQRTDLTPQERRIASLGAERLTNPEIAARLYLSPATVDYHLRKVFRKLNITTRRQLGEALRHQTSI